MKDKQVEEDLKNIGGGRYKAFTFPDSGEKIWVRRISPLLAVKLRQAKKPPSPPMQKVNYGTPDHPDWREEENTASPVYLADLQDYNADLEKRMQRFMIRRGTFVEMTDAIKEQVRDVRELMAEEGVDLSDESDSMVYILYIAVTSDDDLRGLLNAIVKVSQPTEEAIKAHMDSFQPPV